MEENITGVPMVTMTLTPTKTMAPTPTEAPAKLTVYSHLSSFKGEQKGWFADIILDKFNVILTIQPDLYENEGEEKSADIIVFGTTGEMWLSVRIVQGSWNAIFADSEETFDAMVSGMLVQARECGYEDCISWCRQEAVKRFAMEQEARK